MYIFNLKSCLALLCGVGAFSGLSAEFHYPGNLQTNPGSFNNQGCPDYSNNQKTSSYYYQDSSIDANRSDFQQRTPSYYYQDNRRDANRSDFQQRTPSYYYQDNRRDASRFDFQQRTPSYYYQDSSRDANRSDFQRNQNNNYNQIQRDAERQGQKRTLSLAQNRTEAHTITDQDLKKRIGEKIGSGWFSKGYDKVTVEVKNGVVTLGGSVKDQGDKDKVEKEVRNMEGVKSLSSQIVVSEPSGNNKNDSNKKFANDTFSSSADEQLNKKIRDNVSRGWLWDSYDDVSLSTVGGVVTLNGEVDDRDAETKLIQEVGKIQGVKAVKSNLKIDDNDE